MSLLDLIRDRFFPRSHADEVVDRLMGTGQDLAPDLRNEVVALGSSAIKPLLKMITRSRLRDLGYAGPHAIALLCELNDPAVIDPLLNTLDTLVEDEDLLFGAITLNLPRFGSATVEAVLERWAHMDDGVRPYAAEMLTLTKIKDERIYSTIQP